MAPVEATSAPPTRRCWRCLQHFACDAADVHPGHAEWWLCDPCHQSLLPSAPSAAPSTPAR